MPFAESYIILYIFFYTYISYVYIISVPEQGKAEISENMYTL